MSTQPADQELSPVFVSAVTSTREKKSKKKRKWFIPQLIEDQGRVLLILVVFLCGVGLLYLGYSCTPPEPHEQQPSAEQKRHAQFERNLQLEKIQRENQRHHKHLEFSPESPDESEEDAEDESDEAEPVQEWCPDMSRITGHVLMGLGGVLLLAFCCAPQLSLTKPVMLYDAMPMIEVIATAVKDRQRAAQGLPPLSTEEADEEEFGFPDEAPQSTDHRD
eukprot:m.80122 g.80122  ORF g.80122 m.80122 type:complete len:220 (-) comp50681_c0_seq7:2274-2933(-)